ncbi:hypothetical protein [Cryobacterium sp. Y50]|uniref:hypothetical protein n=1 Tax=Cryobacterium sp. Y50 TaxID=2048286 RepID=UPI000CE495C1|nr:hypothetical protein [Cryobacterium sp. Y50]
MNHGDFIASLTVLTLVAVAVLWDSLEGSARLDAEPIAILNPALWPWSISGLYVLIAARAALSIKIFIAGHWTTAMAIVNTTLAILFMSLMTTLLGRGELINPELILAATEYSASTDMPRSLALIAGFTIVGFASWSIAIGWRRTARTSNR